MVLPPQSKISTQNIIPADLLEGYDGGISHFAGDRAARRICGAERAGVAALAACEDVFLGQALLLAVMGGALGTGMALLLVTLLSAVPIWLIVIWTIPAMVVLTLLSSLYPLWLIWQIRPAEILRTGVTVSSGEAKLWGVPLASLLSPLWSLNLRNLARSRGRTLLAIISLCLSTLLLVVMFSGVLALRQTLTGMLLGDYVLLETALPQIAGCVFAVVLAFLSVADLLLLHVRERQHEIGLLLALGWRARLVQQFSIREGLIYALIGALPGILLAEGILSTEHVSQQIVSPLLVVLGAMLLMMAVAAVASIPALRAIQRLPVHDILRAG